MAGPAVGHSECYSVVKAVPHPGRACGFLPPASHCVPMPKPTAAVGWNGFFSFILNLKTFWSYIGKMEEHGFQGNLHFSASEWILGFLLWTLIFGLIIYADFFTMAKIKCFQNYTIENFKDVAQRYKSMLNYQLCLNDQIADSKIFLRKCRFYLPKSHELPSN